MPRRQEALVSGEYYHIFNRGIDRSVVFRNARDYEYFSSILPYYRFVNSVTKFSRYETLPDVDKTFVHAQQVQSGELVTVYAYAFMPNHFHLVVKQEQEHGIHNWLFKSLNSFSKYINTKRIRKGSLFQGNFQAVRIESDERFLHVVRYVHINPVVAGMISMESLISYPWTSYSRYFQMSPSWINTDDVIGMHGSREVFGTFTADQVDYGKTLAELRHAAIDLELSTSEVAGKSEADIL